MSRQLKLPISRKNYPSRKQARPISTREFNHVVMTSRIHLLRLYRFEIERIIERTQKRYPWKIRALAIMPDHLHFLIQVPSRQVFANVMRMLAGQIAILIGRGKIWRERIWSRVVGKNRDERGVMRYIFRNPVKAGLFTIEDCFCIVGGILWGSFGTARAAPGEGQAAFPF